MITAPFAIRILVPDLVSARQWYSQVLDREPDYVSTANVSYQLEGCLITLGLGEPAAIAQPMVFWGVEDLGAELQRLGVLGIGGKQPLQKANEASNTAVLVDPFGNCFGLLERKDPARFKSRNQRAAEHVALRNVRETLDNLQQEEQQQRRTSRWVTALVSVAVLLLASTLGLGMLLRSQHAEDGKGPALTPPALQR